ncbi:MAG: iron-sulfur cluster repair di-iron protein [Acidobacteria bacterium]|nr:MAG: iron-sulfur cluster repair di-iron protein [Acidobacteriota bacterium]
MAIDTQRTVAEIALEKPQAAAVFEKLGIDYCCGGGKPLAVACEEAGIDVNAVEGLLDEKGKDGPGGENWSERSLASLVTHIVEKHHAYCREESHRLQPLLAKVISKHVERHPELSRIEELFTSLRNELSMHMMKEEQMLFPYIVRLEEAASQKAPAPRAPFGTVQNPVRMMLAEHDDAGHLVKEIRDLSGSFTAPEDACTSFRTLYQSLEAFEADLHLHIHLENNLLFPKAIDLENAAQTE